MILSDYLAFAGLIVSVVVYISFIIEERGKPLSVRDYFLTNHKGTSNQFGSSFAAASTSLATVLMFFIAATSTYGPYLFWCGISYFIGQFLFLRFMKSGEIKTTNLTTNANFWFQETEGFFSANSIRAITILSFFVILFLELYIGSEIVNYYLQNYPAIPKVVSFGSIALIVLIYVRFGGMRVVLRSNGVRNKT